MNSLIRIAAAISATFLAVQGLSSLGVGILGQIVVGALILTVNNIGQRVGL